MGHWVAAAYNNRFYTGTIISFRGGVEQIEVVDFLSKTKNNCFKWPKAIAKGVDSVWKKTSEAVVQTVGNDFVVNNLDEIKKKCSIP